MWRFWAEYRSNLHIYISNIGDFLFKIFRQFCYKKEIKRISKTMNTNPVIQIYFYSKIAETIIPENVVLMKTKINFNIPIPGHLYQPSVF